MKVDTLIIVLLLCLYSIKTKAQGPPITSDKPIMLSGKTIVARTLTEIRTNSLGTFTKATVMGHYLPSSQSLVAIHLPAVYYDSDSIEQGNGFTLGDLELLFKYQLYTKDNTGKTFRIVAKTLQTLPTGKQLNVLGISTGKYQSYFGAVAGYESLKIGISNELGYNIMFDGEADELRYKLGIGVPLLRPSYPVNQLNLYFESQTSWYTTLQEYKVLYAQGIQYAKGKFTMELAFQFPLFQDVSALPKFETSFIFGGRYIF